MLEKLNKIDNRKKILLLLCGAGLLAFISLLVNLEGTGDLWPSDADISKQHSDVKALRDQLKQLSAARISMESLINSVKSEQNSIWLFTRRSNPDLEIRNKIEGAAKRTGLKVRYLGPPQKSRVCAGVFTYDVSISSNGKLESVINFLMTLQHMRPAIGWKNVSIMPERVMNPENLELSGTLRIISVKSKALLDLLGMVNK
ncbi:hypothetical protein P0136_01680 [Lentisphaerota bacterium ZTH]|nr:hypothetical protein JYG24_07180 [Lentisphaerota bacterium]WET06723.1 hypothetical protein P0136_01680 [Lentisphaerota bacterium ZTH]